MTKTQQHRQARQDLVNRLILEYAGAVPAGQVLAAVMRADRMLSGYRQPASERLALCEQLVRHRLVERAAKGGDRPVTKPV